jgi:hypothetical protein
VKDVEPADPFVGALEMEDPSDHELAMEVYLRQMAETRDGALEKFKAAAAREPDPTQFEMIEEWDRDTKKIRWYYRRR